MSSLLQHSGPIDKRGVGLTCYLVTVDADLDGYEFETCLKCGKRHEKLYRFFRKPAGMLGQFVQFRINGAVKAPDLSIPMRLARRPRDAKPLTPEEAVAYWHSK